MRVLECISIALCVCISLVFADTENYRVTSEAAAKKGAELTAGTRYAFLEYWAVSRFSKFPPNIVECFTGYKHVRLIVGSPTRGTSRTERDFVGKAWDLYVPEEGSSHTSGTLTGGKNAAESIGFTANKNTDGKVVGPNLYQYVGPLGKKVNDACVKSFSDQFIRDHPDYSLLPGGANCASYATWMSKQVTQGTQ